LPASEECRYCAQPGDPDAIDRRDCCEAVRNGLTRYKVMVRRTTVEYAEAEVLAGNAAEAESLAEEQLEDPSCWPEDSNGGLTVDVCALAAERLDG